MKLSPFKPSNKRHGGKPNFTNVYVKNFPDDLFTTEESFKTFFTKFGEVTSVYFPLDEENKSKGFGFVNFRDSAVARTTVEKLHEQEPHKLYVAKSLNKAMRRSLLHTQFLKWRHLIDCQTAGRNVYVKNITEKITEDVVRSEFTNFGEIESLKLMCDERGVSKGFGYVLFKSTESAANAIKSLHGKIWSGKALYAALFQRRHLRQQQMEAQAQNNRKFIQSGYGGGMPAITPNQQMIYGGQIPPPMMFGHGQIPQQQYAGSQRWAAPMQRGMIPPQIAVSPRQQQQQQMPQRSMPQQQEGFSRQSPIHQGNVQRQSPISEAQIPEPIGDQIYRLVSRIDESRASKVTGMFLKMDQKDLQTLLSDMSLFDANVKKAISLLEEHDNPPCPQE